MPVAYHVTIKKEYAEAILADLEKMDAVTLSRDEDSDVPELQKKKCAEGLRRLKRITPFF